MLYKLFIVFALFQVGLVQAQSCEKMLSPGEFYKVDIKKCVDVQKRSEKELFVDDSLRESGKEIKNNRAPSVEVMYGKSSRQ